MPKHVVFADANVPTFETIEVAHQRGYEISLIRSKYRMYTETPFVLDVTARIDRIIDIDDPTRYDQMTGAIKQAGSVSPIDAVITQLEPCVDTVADACASLGLRFTNAHAVRIARDKAKARQVISEAGLASAAFEVVQSPESAAAAAAKIGHVIVKPQTSYDSLLAYTADTPDEARDCAAKLLAGIDSLAPQLREQVSRGILVEERLRGELVSAELGMRDGQFYRFMLSGRPRSADNECIEMGASMPADVSAEMRDACFTYAENVARAIGLDIGIFHIEMIITGRGPVLVEVNPRLMGGVMPGMYKHATGDDICAHLLDIHLGLPIRFNDQKPSRFITSRKLMPKQGGQLAANVDVSWVSCVDSIVHFSPYKLNSMQHVERLDILARYEVECTTMTEANNVAESVLSRFEKTVGIPLIR
jgi:biotin carboxylase